MSKLADTCNRLIEAAEILLENMDDMEENIDPETGEQRDDVTRLRAAIERYQKARRA